MERWKNCVAVVTGASSGIGEAIAKDLVAAGLRVVALARREDRLNENRLKIPLDDRDRYFARKCDVTDEDDVIAAFAWIAENLGRVDILVNNAGVYREGKLLDMKMTDIDTVLSTNVKGLVCCSREAFNIMKARNIDGHLIHINSVAGHEVMMGRNGSLNMYPPSKFAVTAINSTLRYELRMYETKIKSTSISPGAVMTEIAPVEDMKSYKRLLNPEDVSQAVLYVISTPPHVQIHELTLYPVGQSL